MYCSHWDQSTNKLRAKMMPYLGDPQTPYLIRQHTYLAHIWEYPSHPGHVTYMYINIGSVQKSSSILWGKWLICVLIIDEQCRDLGIYKLLRKGTHKKENRNRMLEKCKKYWHSLVLVLDQGNELLIEDAAFTKPSNLQKNKRLLLQIL